MQLNAKQSFFVVVSGYLLGSLTLWSNSWVGGMRRNIRPAAAGPAGPAATALAVLPTSTLLINMNNLRHCVAL